MNSSSDDEDAEMLVMLGFLENNRPRPRRPKRMRPRPNHMEEWDDEDFVLRFRLKKQTVVSLLEKINHRLETRTNWNMAVTPMQQLLLTLRFYALGSMQIAASDFGGIHRSTACKIIHRVTHAIASLSPEYIKFPDTPEGLRETQNEFYRIAGFPRVYGAIDCSHIKIQSPGGNHAEYYRNRKGWFSIVVQTICDAKLRVLDIVASWPGSTHDSSIFNGSAIKARFDSGEMGDGLLLGDSGYPVLPYLIVPLLNPAPGAETLFNESQIRTRNPVERQYGVWKRRFPILSLGMRMKTDTVLAVIVATAVLHNIACDSKEEEPPRDPGLGQHPLDDDMPPIPPTNAAAGNNRVRQALIDEYFARLPH